MVNIKIGNDGTVEISIETPESAPAASGHAMPYGGWVSTTGGACVEIKADPIALANATFEMHCDDPGTQGVDGLSMAVDGNLKLADRVYADHNLTDMINA